MSAAVQKRALALAAPAVALIHRAKPKRAAAFVCARDAELFDTAPAKIRSQADDDSFVYVQSPRTICEIAAILATEGEAATHVKVARAAMADRAAFVVVVLPGDAGDEMVTIRLDEVPAT